MTQKQKLERFDAVAAERDKLQLAVHDLVNGKFSAAIRINLKEFDADWQGGFYSLRVSMRAMPIFQVRYVVSAQDDQCDVYTDQEIQDLYRKNPASTHARVIMAGRNALLAKYEVAA